MTISTLSKCCRLPIALCFWLWCCLSPVYALSKTQQQAIVAVMGSQTPLWQLAPQDYTFSGLALGSFQRSNQYVELHYQNTTTKGMSSRFVLEQHQSKPRDAKCTPSEKPIVLQHQSWGALTLCSRVMPNRSDWVLIRGFVLETQPYIKVDFQGPPKRFMALMKNIRPLSLAHLSASAPQRSTSQVSRGFYPQQIKFNKAGFAPGDEKLYWNKSRSQPVWSQIYHQAIPFIEQDITFHFTVGLRHTPYSQIVRNTKQCGRQQKKQRYQHPQLGPYLLCMKHSSSSAPATARVPREFSKVSVFAYPLAGNKRPHASFHFSAFSEQVEQTLRAIYF